MDVGDVGKRLYETLDALAEARGDDGEIADVVAMMAGLVWQPPRGNDPGHYAHDPDMTAVARQIAYRWLRDHNYRS